MFDGGGGGGGNEFGPLAPFDGRESAARGDRLLFRDLLGMGGTAAGLDPRLSLKLALNGGGILACDPHDASNGAPAFRGDRLRPPGAIGGRFPPTPSRLGGGGGRPRPGGAPGGGPPRDRPIPACGAAWGASMDGRLGRPIFGGGGPPALLAPKLVGVAPPNGVCIPSAAPPRGVVFSLFNGSLSPFVLFLFSRYVSSAVINFFLFDNFRRRYK